MYQRLVKNNGKDTDGLFASTQIVLKLWWVAFAFDLGGWDVEFGLRLVNNILT